MVKKIILIVVALVAAVMIYAATKPDSFRVEPLADALSDAPEHQFERGRIGLLTRTGDIVRNPVEPLEQS